MISSNLKITTINGIKKASHLEVGEKLLTVELDNYKSFWYPIKRSKASEAKLYNFNFAAGTLSCTHNQLVLCSHKKVIEIGEALINKVRIHTLSGLLLPHSVENSSAKGESIDVRPVGWGTKSVILAGIFCV